MSSDQPGSAPARYPGLDEMRALAVIAVMFQHWSLGLTEVELGRFGVQVFFTISGFLITGILLKSRLETSSGRQTVATALRTFYYRRFLRIFPPYYLVVLLAAALNLPLMRESFWWNVGYLSNVLMGHVRHEWLSSYGGHFWSLSIEEQFYLVWPLLTLLLRPGHLQVVCAAMIAGACCWRYFLFQAGAAHITIFVDTFANLDSLGFGALGALSLHRYFRSKLFSGILLCIGLAGSTWCNLHRFSAISAAFFNLSIACSTLGAIAIVTTSKYRSDSLLLRPLRALGRVSYGVYLYHPYAVGLVGAILAGTPLPYPARILCYGAVTVAMAMLSWRLFESQILKFKDKFGGPAAMSAFGRRQSVHP